MHKILFITGGMGGGGAERVISILANEFSRRGNEVYILQILFSDCRYDLEKQIHRIDISNSKMNQFLDTPRIIYRTRKVLKEVKPDVVFSFMVAINIVSWIASRFSGIKYVAAERNDPNVGRGRLLKIIQKIVYANADKTVFQTKRAQQYFSKRIVNNSVIIPNPIIVDGKAKEPCNKIITVGRLERQKNHMLLLNAFAEINKLYPAFTLEIYGEGSLRKTITDEAKKLGISNSVILHGNVKDVHSQIADAYMFVLSSNFEGLSNALLEAQMLGLPCISTNCAGSDEAIEDGVTGFIVGVGDKEALVNSMKKLIEDRKLRDFIGKNASNSCERYSVDSVLEKWEELIP